MRAVIGRTTTQNIKVNTTGGIIQSTTPITLKNQVTEIRSIEDISDVAEVDVVEGATLVYNPENDKYEVRKLEAGDLSGDINLDGGVF
jgi:hypothetical protein